MSRPNFLLLITDHQRADSIGMQQNGREVTPHLNAFARDNAHFRRAYTTAPLCIPARTAMATGVYPTRGNPINDFTGTSAREQTLFTQRLSDVGYRIAWIGKNDIYTRPPLNEQPSDSFFVTRADYEEYRQRNDLGDIPNNRPGFREHFYKEVGEFLTDRTERRNYSRPATGVWDGGELEQFCDFYLYRETARFLEQAAADETPFAACFSIPSPHPPLNVPEPYASLYDPEQLVLPDNVGQSATCEPSNRAQAVARQLSAGEGIEKHRAAWAAHLGLVSLADDIVGRLLADLDRLQLADSTVVIFTSDHGHHLGQHNMFGINELYEQTINVPLIVRIPGGQPRIVDKPVGHLDLAPTILDLAGVQVPESLTGLPLGSAQRSADPFPERPMFCQFSGQIGVGDLRRGMVTERYKFIYDPRDIAELYDLCDDPLEMNNLAPLSEYREIVAELFARCRDWHRSQEDWIDWNTHGITNSAEIVSTA